MPLSISQVTFDCQDAQKLAQFWSQAFGRDVDPGANAYFASIGRASRAADGPALMFIQVPEAKQVKNRVHLDLTASDWHGEAERLEQLGAVRVAEFEEFGTQWVTMLDPEGNEFDLGAGQGK
jgi:predicted enzyme related to lactoylglutathione lyase